MKELLLLPLLFITVFSYLTNYSQQSNCIGNNAYYDWATAHDTVTASRSIKADNFGNSYVTGFLYEGGEYHFFVSKYDQSGNLQWDHHIGSDYARAYSLDLDQNNNIYVTGSFRGNTDFDPGPGVFNMTDVGSNDIFILKLNTVGDFVWAKQFGGSGQNGEQGWAISVHNDYVYTTGKFRSSGDFDPGPMVYNLNNAIGEIFVQKLDTAGNFIWAKNFSGSGFPYSIEADNSNNIYVSGSFQATDDFDPGVGVQNLTLNDPNGNGGAGYADAFILKLDQQGNFVWAKSIGGSSHNQGYSIDLDVTGNVYTLINFNNTVDFDPGSSVYNLTGSLAILKLDPSGNFIWAKSWNGVNSNEPGLTIDDSNDVYFSSSYSNTVDFDPGMGVSNISGGGVCIVKLDENGNYVWATSFAGSGHSHSVDVDADINVYSTGQFSYLDFDASSEPAILSGGDLFVAKLSQNILTTLNDTINSNQTYFFNNQYLNTEGTYYDTIITSLGCDSIIRLKLAVITQISQTICTGTTFDFNGTILSAPGLYYDTLVSGLGQDSIIELTLNISQIAFSLSYDTLSYCSTSPIQLDAGAGFSSYLWSTGIYTSGVEFDDATWTSCVSAFESYPNWDSSQTNQTITVNQSATYYVQVTNSNGCEAIDSVVVSMLQPTISGDTIVNSGDTAVLLGVIDGVGFLLNSYDTVFANTSTNLQTLMNNVSSGTVIVLDSGTYFVNLVWPSTNHIILTSSYGPEHTILDGSNAQESVIYLGNGQVGVVIDNLHIKNGYGTIPTFHGSIRFGGGILVDEDVRGVIKNCLITKNGIAPSDEYSGGLFVSYRSEVYLINNTITDNYGPVWWRSGNSSCMSGWGTREFGRDGVCMNNIMFNNAGDGLYIQYALPLNSIQIRNNNSYGNSPNWYNGSGGGSQTGINDNISQDPLFVNAADGNYRLSPSSPSLSAGENGVKQGYENYFNLNDLIYHPELIIYSWSTGDSTQQIMVTPNQTIEYCLTVSDGIQSCSTTTCSEVQLPAIIEQITDSICDGDQYNFNGNLLATVGVYNDTLIASSGQDSVVILTLLVNSLPSVTAGSDQTICLGNTVIISGNGATSYTWDNGVSDGVAFTPVSTAVYTVTGTDGNDCVNSDQVEVTVNVLPTVNAGTDVSICAGDQVTLIGSGASTYSWDNGVTDGVSFTPSIGVNTYTVTGTDANGCIGVDMLSVTSTSISLSVLPTNVTCNGGNNGAIDINFNSAGAPYTFQWSNGETTQNLQNISAGLYSLTINSAIGCDTTIQVSINQPPPLQTNIDITNTSCDNQDGTASLVIINPYNQPYTTTWSNGDVGLQSDSLSSGSINAIITDAIGCLFYDAAAIGSSGGATVNIGSVTNVSCPGVNDGAISLDITTQNPPYTVNWISGQSSQQISGLGSGVYEYLVEDQSGCLSAGSAEILQPDSISLANVNLTSPTCGNNDGSIEVNGQGGSGNLIYIWGANTGSQQGATAANLYAGTYTLNVVDDNSCVHIETILLNDLSAPEIDIVNINNPQCGGGLGAINIAVSNGTPPYSYLWNTDSTTEDINGLVPGNYVVLVSDALGCTSTEFIELNGILPPNPGVCLVTVDTTTQTNLVVWEKPLVAGSISHYTIYREGIAAGVYDSIATIPYDSLSQYTDTLANPFYRSWSYKITVIDTCGNESLPSLAHKTIHLTVNTGLSNVINLIWDNYAGFNYSTYYVNRYHPSTGWSVISILPSSLTSYTDQSPLIPSNTLIYSIEVVPPSICTSTKAQDHNSTRSNRANIIEGGGQGQSILQQPNSKLSIYPNPTSDQIAIDIKGYNGPINVEVYDLQGRLLETTTNTIVSLKKHAKGIYVLKVSYGEITEEVRVVRD